jgi:hypothetical protein
MIGRNRDAPLTEDSSAFDDWCAAGVFVLHGVISQTQSQVHLFVGREREE